MKSIKIIRVNFALAMLMFISSPVLANNLLLSNGILTSQNTTADTIKLQFDLSWENSWRDAVNYDAAWVIMKYSTDSGANWHHATLKNSGTNPGGFSIGSGTVVEIGVPADLKGCFVYRAGNGSGTVSTQGIQLVWNYGADGVSDSDANGLNTRVKIIGIEMVYIPEGSYLAGDADADKIGCFKAGKLQDLPISVNSENALVFNNQDNGPYYYQSASNDGETASGSIFTVPSNFPKGYKAFYLMKYEISQGLWLDFFNTLTNEQKATRDLTSDNDNGKNRDDVTYRNAVSWTSGDAPLVNSREYDRACNYLSWKDLCSFSDWAALRPYTELEYEKACRGSANSVDDEYAWGNAIILSADSISGTEDGGETVANSGANACYNNTLFTGGDAGRGPLRNGIFATSSSDRISAGAGYFGVMELSGNLWERCVTIGNSNGLSFTGSNGDGVLNGLGNATNADWPGIDSVVANGVTGATGSGFKGGSWFETMTSQLTVADRSLAAKTDSNRDSKYGGRCARSMH